MGVFGVHTLVLTVSLFVVSSAIVDDNIPEDVQLLLMHTNDVHARVEQFASGGGACTVEAEAAGTCVGGVARRATRIKALRQRFPTKSLLLDAGDQFQGTLWYQYYKGNATKLFMKKLGYDVMALGNHEFDDGVAGLVPFLENSPFPILAANIDLSNEPRMQGLVQPSLEREVGGHIYGIVGYITQETAFLVSPSGIKNLRFTDEIKAVREEVLKFKDKGIKRIIALGHAGFDMDKRIAAEVEGVDIVVGGHTNTFLYTGDPPSSEVPVDKYPTVVPQNGGGQALVVQDYAYGKYLGKLGVKFDDNGVITDHYGLPELLDSTIEQDPEILKEVEELAVVIRELGSQEVGETKVLLNGDRTFCRLVECNLGNLMTDALVNYYLPETTGKFWTNASIAVWNGGGIRDSINQGTVRMEDLYRVWPFGNEVEMIRLRGKTLRAMLEHSVEAYDPHNAKGAFLQMSGLMVTYDLALAPLHRVVEAWVRCAHCDMPDYHPLDDEAVYDILMTSFMADGGDEFSMLPDDIIARLPYGEVVPPIMNKYFQQMSPITQGLERRIIIRNAPGDENNGGNYPRLTFLTLMLCILAGISVNA